MGLNKLFWCNNCQRFETIKDAAEHINRPTGWTRIEIQSSTDTGGAREVHLCATCGEGFRQAFFAFLHRQERPS